MRFIVLIGALALALPSAFCDDSVVDYTNHKVIRILPSSLENVAKLLKMEQDFGIDYWNPALPDLRPVLTLLDPNSEIPFLHALNSSAINYEVVANNYQMVIDNERAQMMMRSRSSNYGEDFDYEYSYHTYDEIVSQVKFLANKYPTTSKYISVGNSYEGREIPAITVGTGSKVIFFECGMHSREWITVAFGTWVINKLLSNSEFGPLLQNYQFVILPVANVDGYYLTHNGNRLWRKTRSKNSGTTCLGADPNRNWDSAFCQTGASTNPCSETYCGKSAFSEIETQLVSNLIKQYKGKIAAYFSIHSYTQLWMYPWGYSNKLPSNVAELKRIAQSAVSAIKGINGLDFTEGSISNTIYLASGSSIDWIYDTQDVKITYAIELRDKGQYGFQLPANQIKPSVEETWAGLKAAIDQLS